MIGIRTIKNEGISEIKKLCVKYGISPTELSIYIRVTPVRIYEIMSGKRRITPNTDVRLCRFFKLTTGYFASKQLEYDLALAEEELQSKKISIVPVDKTLRG